MELTDVINKLSVMYRAEMKKKDDITLVLNKINGEFQAAAEHDWETMSHARWSELNYERSTMEDDKKYHAIRAEAMFDVREMFLELLDAEMGVEEN